MEKKTVPDVQVTISRWTQVRKGAPREIGLFLISLGTLAIVFGCIDFWQEMKTMRDETGKPFRKFPLILAALTGGLGILLIIRILIRAS